MIRAYLGLGWYENTHRIFITSLPLNACYSSSDAVCIAVVICTTGQSKAHYETITSRPVTISPLICPCLPIDHTFALLITPPVNHPLLHTCHVIIIVPHFSQAIFQHLWVSVSHRSVLQTKWNSVYLIMQVAFSQNGGIWRDYQNNYAQCYNKTKLIFRKSGWKHNSSRCEVLTSHNGASAFKTLILMAHRHPIQFCFEHAAS